jgi:hypothetical protein
MTWMRTCREISELASQREERPLSAAERFALYVHLPVCRGCRNFVRQLAFLRAAVRRYRDRPQP